MRRRHSLRGLMLLILVIASGLAVMTMLFRERQIQADRAIEAALRAEMAAQDAALKARAQALTKTPPTQPVGAADVEERARLIEENLRLRARLRELEARLVRPNSPG